MVDFKAMSERNRQKREAEERFQRAVRRKDNDQVMAARKLLTQGNFTVGEGSTFDTERAVAKRVAKVLGKFTSDEMPRIKRKSKKHWNFIEDMRIRSEREQKVTEGQLDYLESLEGKYL